MKPKELKAFDKAMLRKRAVIESVNDQLKNISQIEHTRLTIQFCCKSDRWPHRLYNATKKASYKCFRTDRRCPYGFLNVAHVSDSFHFKQLTDAVCKALTDGAAQECPAISILHIDVDTGGIQ